MAKFKAWVCRKAEEHSGKTMSPAACEGGVRRKGCTSKAPDYVVTWWVESNGMQTMIGVVELACYSHLHALLKRAYNETSKVMVTKFKEEV